MYPSILQCSAIEMAGMIRRGEVTAETVIRAHLDRLAELNTVLNAVIQWAPESALEQARAADAAIAAGKPVGPLHGVPFTVKDVYAVGEAARLVAVPGRERLLDLPRDRDGTAVARLREAGAILIGVTRATWWTDREALYGPVKNPYNLEQTPGGSSGGEAAVIAACGSPLGLGSDSGGSLRDPACACGIATIRPSNGRVPQATDGEGTADPRTVAGPLARSVADVALALRIISGVDPRDPTTLPLTLGDPTDVSMKGLRVAVFPASAVFPPTPETAQAVKVAAEALRAGGAVLVDAEVPDIVLAWDITNEYWRGYPEGPGARKTYAAFLARWDRYRVAINLFMQDFDIVVCPVRPGPYPAVFSLAGLPVAVVRAGTEKNGLPIGVQLAARPWRDEVALAAAMQVERATGGWLPPPV